ncbi:GGDEF domain-containing phosphodiesterase [Sphingomonas sp. CL5.1]|uniref:GGDEF domain-containing phosphodiesterase n=1 Tax=Sphingomonas sp. CL5.1 TaxID=2653203 RepID=UPI0020C614E5|nr:GGDEF domain-containing phosphodiesterase [Sphingomonas sp. CL5.1]
MVQRRSDMLREEAPSTQIEQARTAPPVANSWRLAILAEVTNFVPLRRLLGSEGVAGIVRKTARRLAAVVPGGTVAVIGRDLIEIEAAVGAHAEYEALLSRLRAASAVGIETGDGFCTVSLLLGGAIVREAEYDAVTLIERAEAALERARGSGYDGPVLERGPVDMRLASELERAIACDELLMLYQPKFHVRRQKVTCAEALIRWRHPTRGMIPPMEFIPVAEEAHMIDRVTLWSIRRVIEDQRLMRAAGHDLRLFVNISGQLLSDPTFVSEACALVASSGATLGFEITETSVIRDPVSAIANLQVFADIGIRIAIDDYGAGLSSLAYLKQLPASELKIDKLFVTQLTSSNRDPLIVRSTIDLAHALEMEVVAEGVESHAALALLTVMGCDIVQGFLISRPVSTEALIAFLADESWQPTAGQESRGSFNRLAAAWKRG